MSFPVNVPILSLEIKQMHLADTAPTPATGYSIIEVEDLGYTKLWMEYKVTQGGS